MHSLFLVTKQERWIYAEASKTTAVVGHYHPFLSKLNSKVVSNDAILPETMAGMFITGPNSLYSPGWGQESVISSTYYLPLVRIHIKLQTSSDFKIKSHSDYFSPFLLLQESISIGLLHR